MTLEDIGLAVAQAVLNLLLFIGIFTGWWYLMKAIGWAADRLSPYALYWWAVLALALSPRDSTFARDIRCKHDMHDYYDGPPYEPDHFITYKCDRCGKTFVI